MFSEFVFDSFSFKFHKIVYFEEKNMYQTRRFFLKI